MSNPTIVQKQQLLENIKNTYQENKDKKDATAPRYYDLEKIYREEKIELMLKTIGSVTLMYLLYRWKYPNV